MSGQQRSLKASLDKGLVFLRAVQRPDGGFDSYSSLSANRFQKRFTYQTTFAPSLMLAALSDLPASHSLRSKLAGFVKAQIDTDGVNYWAKHSIERQLLPYPNDLDDTCCALIGLVSHRSDSIDSETLATLVKLLIAAETESGGPYRTWLVPRDSPPKWLDVDLAVNCNVAYLLSFISKPLPKVTAFLEKAILTRDLNSSYYPSAYPLLYFLSRSYQGPLLGRLHSLAKELYRQERALTPLKSSLLLSSLLRLKVNNLEPLVSSLLASQQPDGSWSAAAFCLDPARENKKYYNGSAGLTTAFVLEALQAYHLRSVQIPHQSSPQCSADNIMVIAGNDSKDLQQDLSASLLGFIRNMVYGPGGEDIIALPVQFNQSLVQPLGREAQPWLARLSLGNLYGWSAYTIFDNVIDDDEQSSLIPVAMTALRYSISTFEAVFPEDNKWQKFLRQVFNVIDGANAWELANCRLERRGQKLIITSLPTYISVTDLADRSLGHCLTPLAILWAKGLRPGSKQFRSLQRALVHYLTARQLNDDLHDWQPDMEKGHASYVVSHIMSGLRLKAGEYGISNLARPAQEQFWNHSLAKLCQIIVEQTALGRTCLSDVQKLQKTNVISRYLDEIDLSIAKTLAAQSQASNFLRVYKSRPSGLKV